jgi:outer membrane receptor protein involved in Fe transport
MGTGRFLAAMLGASFVLVPGSLWSQNPDRDETGKFDEDGVIEEVVVTGSRIRRSNLDSPSPVLVIDAKALVDGGITTMGEFARYLPQNNENISDGNSGGSIHLGASGINLRGIGFDGTLTLVNGRRIAPFGPSGDEAPYVDINAIPVAAIERIEILKDGASAIYGSEAVAGVVNVILKERVDGVTVEAGYLTTDAGDGDEWDANIVGGWNTGSTRFVGTLSWFKRDRIWRRDRPAFAEIDRTDQGGPNQRSTLSSPPTIALLESGLWRADPACPDNSELNSREVLPVGSDYYEFCRFNWARFIHLQEPAERWSGIALLQHGVSESMTAFGELIYNRTEAESVSAPTPLQSFFVPADHPQNPFGEDLSIYSRALDTGNRGQDRETDTWRAVAGLGGQFRGWDWDAAVTRSESEFSEALRRGVLSDEFQLALLGLGGPGGDQFYNPFGLNPQNPPEVIDGFLISGPELGATTRETTADGQVTGQFGELPGGPVGAAYGVQWREIELKQFADEILYGDSIAGRSNAILPISVDRRIGSAFAEFLLPVIEGFEAQLALRYDHYSDFGSTTNPKIGLGWKPTGDVLVRATWGTSFRAPSFRELYEPPLASFERVSDDPWRCPVTGDFIDCTRREVPATSQGNPDLQPDEGETWLLGVAWEPAAAPGLQLAIDYWEIDHTNRIITSGIPFSVSFFNVFLENLPPDENPYVSRAPPTAEDIALGIPGVIDGLFVTYINASSLDTRGIDFDARYAWTSTGAGDFDIALNYAYLDEYRYGAEVQGVEYLEDWAGGYGFQSGLPQHRGTLGANWSRERHSASALLIYSGSFESWVERYEDGVPTGAPFIIDSYTQLNLQYSYTFEGLRGATLRLGCQNCLDNDPPVYNHGFGPEPFHEARGVLMYARWVQPIR